MAMNAAANIAQKQMGEVPTVASNQDKQSTLPTEMLAVVWEGKNKVAVKKVPVPTITDPEDVIIRVTGTTGKLNMFSVTQIKYLKGVTI